MPIEGGPCEIITQKDKKKRYIKKHKHETYRYF